jgi:hypothetical protein
MNESLLESISLIEESVLDAEMDTLIALGNEYSKIVLLIEYADEEVLNEYEIVQEAFIMEAKEDKEGKPKEGIIAKLKRAWGVIMGLLSKVGQWFAKKVSNVREKFSRNKSTATANPEVQQAVQSCKEDIDDVFDFDDVDFKDFDDPGIDLTDEDVQSIMNNFKSNLGKFRKLKGDIKKLKVIHNKGFIDAARKGNLKKDGTTENIIDKADENIDKVLDGEASKQDILEVFEWMKDFSRLLGMYHEKMMSPEKAAQMPDVENNPKWVNYVKKLWTESNNPSVINAWHARMKRMYPGFKTDYSHFTGYTVKFKSDIADLDDLLHLGSKDQIMSAIHKFLDPSYQFYDDKKVSLKIRRVVMDRSDRFVHDDLIHGNFAREWNNPRLNESDMNEIRTELEKLISVITQVVGELRGYNSFLLYAYDHFSDSFLEEEPGTSSADDAE